MAILNTWFNRLFERLLERSIPAQKNVKLDRKNIFVFPTFYGFLYLVVGVVVWLLGTNYQNNLVLFIAYFMFALCIIVIHHTFNNLTQLKVNFKKAAPVFEGDTATFYFNIQNTQSKKRYSLFGVFRHNNQSSTGVVSHIDQKAHCDLSVQLHTLTRGILKPSRLGLYTFYPLGLLRCWTWLDLKAQCLVYPKPIKMPLLSVPSESTSDNHQTIKGQDDFDHFKRYTQGDEIKHIAWKASSKGKGLFTKQYSTPSSPDMHLSLDDISATTLELKISGFCYWVVYFYQHQHAFSADIGGHIFTLQQSKEQPLEHYHNVLACLATYQKADINS